MNTSGKLKHNLKMLKTGNTSTCMLEEHLADSDSV